MATNNNILLGLFLCLLSTAAMATTRSPRLGGQPEQCRLQQLTASQPSQRIQSEGGVLEMWDSNEDQFRCAGVDPVRITVQPNSLFLPSYQPSPRLVFIEQGQGYVGVHLPGCAETFSSGSQQESFPGRQGQQQEYEYEQEQSMEHHQKLQRFRQGDIIAIPPGAVHWCLNDGNEDVVVVAINDLNNPTHQLDRQFRQFFLAGGAFSQGQQGPQMNFDNIFSGFNTELLAEAFQVEPEIVRQMQRGRERGVITRVQGRMEMVRPEEQQQGQQQPGRGSNGFEETYCSPKIIYNLDNQREADFSSRQAGKLNIVNHFKLPILGYLDLSAEKGYLQPNALFTPHWSMNSHTILYVLRGNAQFQIVSNSGRTVFDQKVNRGDMVVIPQFFASATRAGENGFEWVVFKTNRLPMNNPLAGYTSVLKGLPLEVITNSYQIAPSQAQTLKTGRGSETYLLSPQSQRRTRS